MLLLPLARSSPYQAASCPQKEQLSCKTALAVGGICPSDLIWDPCQPLSVSSSQWSPPARNHTHSLASSAKNASVFEMHPNPDPPPPPPPPLRRQNFLLSTQHSLCFQETFPNIPSKLGEIYPTVLAEGSFYSLKVGLCFLAGWRVLAGRGCCSCVRQPLQGRLRGCGTILVSPRRREGQVGTELLLLLGAKCEERC